MPTPALSEHQINRLRVLLEARQRELTSLLEHSDQASKPVTLDQQAVGRISRIDAIQQQQMALASQEQTQQLLQRVELALERIDAGEYGLCLRCAEPIPYARLEAQLFAGLCLECQSASETR